MLSSTISTDKILTRKLIVKWETILPELLVNAVVGTVKISLSTAETYRYDFYGLLTKLGVSKEFHYPTMRAHGFYTSRDYAGKELEIIALDNAALSHYHTLFTR